MHRLFKELRRREVFRTAGLYVGVAWIVVEVSSVLFDAFEAPEWVLQAVIILAIIGLPVTVVLAWVFDITDRGIEVQADATDTMVVPFGGRRMDFVVIGVLSVALIFSVYLNVAGDREAVVEQIEPISVLIADFDNLTGDERCKSASKARRLSRATGEMRRSASLPHWTLGAPSMRRRLGLSRSGRASSW